MSSSVRFSYSNNEPKYFVPVSSAPLLKVISYNSSIVFLVSSVNSSKSLIGKLYSSESYIAVLISSGVILFLSNKAVNQKSPNSSAGRFSISR